MLSELGNLEHCDCVCKVTAFLVRGVEALASHAPSAARTFDLSAGIDYRGIAGVIAAVPYLPVGVASSRRPRSPLYTALGGEPAVGVLFLLLTGAQVCFD